MMNIFVGYNIIIKLFHIMYVSLRGSAVAYKRDKPLRFGSNPFSHQSCLKINPKTAVIDHHVDFFFFFIL